jgi:arsenate reductase-like glutaredoxin family protein
MIKSNIYKDLAETKATHKVTPKVHKIKNTPPTKKEIYNFLESRLKQNTRW